MCAIKYHPPFQNTYVRLFGVILFSTLKTFYSLSQNDIVRTSVPSYFLVLLASPDIKN
jgi:hypothetical protein